MKKNKVSPIPGNIKVKELLKEIEKLKVEKKELNADQLYELALYNVILKQSQLILI